MGSTVIQAESCDGVQDLCLNISTKALTADQFLAAWEALGAPWHLSQGDFDLPHVQRRHPQHNPSCAAGSAGMDVHTAARTTP